MKLFFRLFELVLLLSIAPLCQAQNPNSQQPGAREYARPGYPTMDVRVWSNAGASGIYRVERDIDFLEFLTVLGAGSSDVNNAVRVEIRVYRGGDDDRSLIYESRLDKILQARQRPPVLQDEDILVIESRPRRFTFQKITSLVGTASSLTLLVIRLANLRGR